MPKVELKGKRILVGGESVPLISGEVHYWRLAPARWREILERVREMGLKTVATYVCWEYHELEPGKFDFTGQTEPQRNLVGFLDLLQAMGFWVIIRPGPYIYSEWKNAGVPDYAARMHRLSPEYQEAARPWMEAVSKVLKPYLATNGGRIALFQPDNEMDLFTHWFEDEVGLQGGSGPFQEFLAERYGRIDELNRAWGTEYKGFDDARGYAEPTHALDSGAKAANLDYWRFQHWATAKAVEWHAQTYREFGIDLPMVHNFYYGGDVQNWRELSKVVDFLGIDLYPSRDFERPGYPGDHRLFLDAVRYQRSLSVIPYIAEFECGVWHGVHEFLGTPTPNQYRLAACSALLAGAAGWNWYMLVNRDNWYYCPIQEWGRVRGELFGEFKDIVRAFDELDPSSLTKLTDTAAVLDPLQIASDGTLRDNTLLQALYEADVDFETLDLSTGNFEKPLVFYAGAEWLSRADQESLVAYVEHGGNLVLFKNAPWLDEKLQPLNLLEVREPDGVLSRHGKLVEVHLGHERAMAEGALFEYASLPRQRLERIRAAQAVGPMQAVENSDLLALGYQGREFTIGYVQQRGKGRILVLGVDPNPALILAIHRYLGIAVPSQADAPGVTTALFRRDGELYLIAANNAKEERRPLVTIPALSGMFQVTDLFTGVSSDAHAPVLVSLAAKSGGAWRISPSR